MIARRDPRGLVTLPARPYIVIRAALRRRCRRAGDHVLLAVPGEEVLVGYSFAVADRAMRAHAGSPARGGCGERRELCRVPASCGGGGDGAAGADGLVPGGTDCRRAGPQTDADLRRVRPGCVRGDERRDPARVRLVMEPGNRALGRPPSGRADPVGDPAADGLHQDPCSAAPQRPGQAQRGRAPCGRAALPVPAQCGRRADRRGRQPGAKVAKPRRLPSTRRALPDNRLAEIN
jgi:hypothetical protein